ncbi:MAG: response regulator [Candidatus Acidiferrales bacterium]|jgi:CheY-like chemotaxis protein
MSATPLTSADAKAKAAAENAAQIERRRRKRAKISAQVHVRAVDSPEPFEEVCKSIDVSRDGLLFTAARGGYWKGQLLDVIFPYSAAAAPFNTAQRAEVVRVAEHGSGQYGVAVQFAASKSAVANENKAVAKGDPFAAGDPAARGNAEQKKQPSVVLAVESDQRTADVMRSVLGQDGYTVIIAPTAQEALEVLRTTVPVCFIAEVEAGDMSGHDLCLIIKRNDRLARVPVILLTRAAQPADYAASHQLGAVVCMAKPFKPERLLHVVRLVAPPPQIKSAYGSRVSSSAIERTL